MKHRYHFTLCAISLLMMTGCHYPAYISFRFDIAITSTNGVPVVADVFAIALGHGALHFNVHVANASPGIEYARSRERVGRAGI